MNGQGMEGKFLGRTFSVLPDPAQYFKGIDDIYFDATASFTEDVEHIVLDGIRNDRYPHEFLAEYAGGFEKAEYDKAQQQYLRNVAERVEQDDELFRRFRNRLSDAIKLARRRAQWNYRAVVPQ